MRRFLALLMLVATFWPWSGRMEAQTPYTTGNLVVLRVGDGIAALSSSSTAIFLDEYSSTGTWVQAHPLPTSGANVFSNSGSATSEGQITLSPDSYYLLLAGYNTGPGLASIANTSSVTVNRKLLRVDNSDGYTLQTSSTAFNANNIRGGVTNGTDFWAAGTSGTAGANGIQYFGTGTPVQVSSTITNTRVVNIFNSQLYFSTGSAPVGIYAVGSGLPVTTGNVSSLVIAGTGTSPSPYGFSFNAATDICYIADDRTAANGGGIQKFTKTAGIWSLQYTLSVGTVGARGLTVDWTGANPVIYATSAEGSANRIVKITDTGAGSIYSTLATSATNTIFRGIAFAPVPMPSPTTATLAASLVESTSATLNGTVNANNVSTTVSFEYGLTDAYGTTVAGVPSPVTGSSTVSVSASIMGLTPGTTYHFRVTGISAGGTSYGSDLTFTTIAAYTGPTSSATPYIIPQSAGVTTTSLLTVPDAIGPFTMCGVPDGLGAFDNNDGTFTLLMNHELGNNLGAVRSHGSIGSFVSKWIINKTTLAVQSGSDLMVNVNLWDPFTSTYTTYNSSNPSILARFGRFCSADLPAPSAFHNSGAGVGTPERIFMTGEEVNDESRGMAHIATGPNAGTSWELPALGKGAWENEVACPASGNRTVVALLNDGTDGQVYFYIGQKTATGNEIERAGLTNGHPWGLIVSGFPVERVNGTTINTPPSPGTAFTLVDLGDVRTLTGAALNTLSNTNGVTKFSRPEDGAWDPQHPNDFYFNTTDQFANGYSRLWKLHFTDILNPQLGGTITAVLDGTEGQKMLDNLAIDQYGHIILQEDVGSNAHNGKMWQYTIATDNLKLVAAHDPSRFGDIGVPATAPFNQDEESSGIIDVQSILGPGKFLTSDQAHYSVPLPAVEGGQLLMFFNPDTYASNLCATTSTTTVNTYTSYSWNGNTYTTPGTYTYHTTNVAGCDSTATLILNFVNFPLQILHGSDFEASTDEVSSAPRFAAIVDSLENTYPNSITLASGDNFIPGPFSFSGEDPRMVLPYRNAYASYYNNPLNPPYDLRAGIARADISIMNFIGVEASVLGNHDFDFGTPELRNIIGGNISGSSVRWFGAQFPYLSSNLNFMADPNLSPVFTPIRQANTNFMCSPANTPAQIAAKKKLAPYCVIMKNGEKIGVVGVTTPMLESISSPGTTTVKNPGAGTNDMTLLATIVQPYIDTLINIEGCSKIILLSHLQQLAFEKELATKLQGVDIIIAGGSHTLMADATDRLRAGDVAIETYPYLTSGLDGKPTAIINTDGSYKYVGRLVVDFTPAGDIVPASINPAVSGAYATDQQGLQDVWGANTPLAFAPGTRGYRVKLLCDSIGSAILAKDGNLFGKTSVFLEGRRNFVRTEETNLGNLSAEANLWMAKFYDPSTVISIKNGGGIRSIIGYINAYGDTVIYQPPIANPAAGKLQGDVSQLDIENSLRFNNLLSLLTVDAAGLRRTLEHGVSATAPGATPGQFPQVAGVRFSYNPTLPVYNPTTNTGGRILTAVITNDSGTVVLDTLIMNGALYGNPSRTFRLATLNFMAGGGDNYPFPIIGSNRIDINTLPVPPAVPGVASFAIPGSEQDAFAEYMKSLHSTSPYNKSDRPVTQDYRIENVTLRTDSVLPRSVSLSVSSGTGNEANQTVITVTAVSSLPVLGNQTVTVAVSGTNITAGDYTLSNNIITILNGQTTGSVTFTVTNDVLFEGTETAVLTISNPSAGLIPGIPLSQSISITDNDATVDLLTYVRIGRYDLPEPTRTAPPANNLLAQEASAVTYNWDTQTLFVVGDGGTSIVQVTKTGQLINSMTLAQGNSPQGTEFYDPEGLTYIGNNTFVMVEERDRQTVKFIYNAGTTLTRSMAQTVKLGTFVDNIGIEGLSYDPQTAGYICVKEKSPEGIFQTGIDFSAGTATNGSPTTVNSVNLFDPALANLSDLADVFALCNLPALTGQSNSGNLLLLSQESVKIENIDRTGVISSSLTIVNDPGNPLSAAEHQHEGITMDNDGFIYTVCENGGGDFDHPQVWIYAPSTFIYANQAPLSVSMAASTTTLAENTSTVANIKLGYIDISDDGMGSNDLSLSGADAGYFEIINNNLYLKAGTVLDYETKSTYTVTVNVNDATIGSTPDVTTVFTLHITDIVETATVIISEVTPWSSGNSPIGADWFEVTNTGNIAANITGWKVDDNSNTFGNSLALNGITSIAPGESVIFIETANLASTSATFRSNWFGANPPSGLQIGNYSGAGIGLSTGGDAVNLYNASGVLQANVSFGTSTTIAPYRSFDNAAGLNNAVISQLSAAGVNGAFIAVNSSNEIGSPGRISCPVVTPTITGALTFCEGSSTVLDAGAGYSSYLWSTTATTQTITVSSAGTYTVTVTTAAICYGTASVTTTVNPSLPVSITIVPSANPVLTGASVTFTATPVNGGISPAYQWNVNAAIVSGATDVTYTFVPTNGDVVNCILTSNAVCATNNPATSNLVTMIVSTIPAITAVSADISNGQTECYNATQTITVGGINGTFNIHNGGSATMIAGVNIIYEPGTVIEAGGYMHGYIAPGGPWCGAKSATIVTTVDEGETKSPASFESSSFVVYPNPSHGDFTIEQKGSEIYSNIHINIYGMQGNKVYSKQNPGNRRTACSLQGISAGIYYIQVVADGKISNLKLVITR
ncbi:MAG: SdiA-regulated domain-containing protein [Bacteroidales bacterium]